jgi:magnesium transporter
MTDGSRGAVHALVNDFFRQYPAEAAVRLEQIPIEDVIQLLDGQTHDLAASVIEHLRPDVAAAALAGVTESAFCGMAPLMQPTMVAPVLARLDSELREARLALLDRALATELTALLSFGADSAGGLMDARVTTVRPVETVKQALVRLREARRKHLSHVYLVDGDGRLQGAVSLQELALAEPRTTVGRLMQSTPAVQATASLAEVVEIIERQRMASLPVVDIENRLVGVIRQDALITAAEAHASADIQSMVGVSREERALSTIAFSVRKRLPWLQINLLTAFLAAFVVGLFESTIATYTALAVLLPVVAGQSGNTGAQALAVTMRGLALREIRMRHWIRVSYKEVVVGVVNGSAVAAVTAGAVYLWSRSLGLAMVIGTAMVASMAMAGLAGAAIPMVLTALRQDPAQSSSIVLTTVTDVVGFLSFLGLATLAAGYL